MSMRPAWRLLLALLALFALTARPAAAQSVLRDAETEQFFKDAARPLILAAGLDPRSVEIVLIGDPSINAFAGGGQNVFIHSGLIAAADDVVELQGILAHELGHIAGGHNVRSAEGTAGATRISILSLLLGAAAIAAGAGDAGAAILAGGQQAAMGRYLAFSREQESRTDQAGASYLATAGISGRGMIAFFRRLLGEEFRLALPQDNAYNRTHPLNGERIAALEQRLKADKAWERPADAALNRRFLRVKGKLIGYVSEPPRTLQLYPVTDQSEAARYARAYAYHKSAFAAQAVAEADALLAGAPDDPYLLELKGQILLENGDVAASLPPLRRAVARSGAEPLIVSVLGHALVQTDDRANLEEARGLLRTSIARDNRNPFAWYQLGVIYDRTGDEPRAALASAERLSMIGDVPGAARSARTAALGLPKGTPDWLRAQDIAMVTATAMKDRRGRGRGRDRG